MPLNKSRNHKRQIKRSNKSRKYGGTPPVIPLNGLLRNIKSCVVHNLNNTILVVNYDLHRIEILDMNRQHIGSFGEHDLRNPRAINVEQQTGNIIVTDRNQFVQVFDRHGMFFRAIRQYGALPFIHPPREVAVTSNGNILISDIENNRICCSNMNGVEQFVLTMYSLGNSVGMPPINFDKPYGVCVGIIDGVERIAIADSHNSKIVIFELDGQLYRYFDTSHLVYVQRTIVNIAIDDNNNIHCIDFGSNNTILIYTTNGHFVRTVQLDAPVSIKPRIIRIDQNTHNIYITDEIHNVIAVFDRNYVFLHLIPELAIDFKIIRKQTDIPQGIDVDYECGTCLEPLIERSSSDVNNSRNNVNGYVVQLHQNEQSQAPHLFHFKCIKGWFRTEGRHRSCPLCRTDCQFYLRLTETDILKKDDGVDFFESVHESHKVAVADVNQINCSEYNGNQIECINHKPKCLWKFIKKECIHNPSHKGGNFKFISKHNKNHRSFYKRSLKKII